MTVIDWGDIGRSVRVARAKINVDQKTAATEIGVTASSLCRLEAGTPVSADTLMRVFLWLGESPIAYCRRSALIPPH